MALSEVGRRSEAEQRCLEALRFKSQAVCAHYNLGRLYLEQKRFEEARGQFGEVLRVDPSNQAARSVLDGIPREPRGSP